MRVQTFRSEFAMKALSVGFARSGEVERDTALINELVDLSFLFLELTHSLRQGRQTRQRRSGAL
jgi:hypothetical protein